MIMPDDFYQEDDKDSNEMAEMVADIRKAQERIKRRKRKTREEIERRKRKTREEIEIG